MIKHFTRDTRVDHRSKESMLRFIGKHSTHTDRIYDPPTIANCIKITRLPIPRDLADLAFDYLDSGEWDFTINVDRDVFQHDHDCMVYQQGRSGGWLELCNSKGQSVFSQFDPPISKENPIEDIRELCHLVEAFDQFCDDLLAEFISELEWYQEVVAAEAAEAEDNRLALLDPPFPMAV